MEINTQNWRTATTIVYFSVFLAIGISASWIGPALPSLASGVNVGLAAISYLFIARYFGVMSGILFGGRVFDIKPGHPIMAAMLALLALLTALVPFTNQLWQMALTFLLLGFASGTLDVGGNSMLPWIYRKNVGPYMNGLHVFFGLGAIMTPIAFVRLFMVGESLRLPLWFFAILLFLPGTFLLLLRSPQPENPAQDFSPGNGMRYLILLVGAFLFMYVGAEVSINGWIYTYSLEMRLTTEVTAAYLTSVFWIFIALGRLAAIPLYSYIRSNTILILDLVGGIACTGLVLAFPGSRIALWSGIAGIGLFLGSVFPTLLSLVEERIGTTGQRTSWFLVGASIGAMLFPWLVGQLFGYIGPRGLMYVALGSLLAAFGLVLLIFQQFNKRELLRESANEN